MAQESSAAATSLSDFDILDLTIGLHMPGLDAIVVVDRIDAADLAQLRLARLHIAGLVLDARLQQQRLTVPVELVIEARQRLIKHGPVEPRRPPIASAVERDINAIDLAVAAPGQTR